jgi:hypothetical protein
MRAVILLVALAGCGGRVDQEPEPVASARSDYRAEAVIGGYDRVHVFRSIPSRDVCLFVGLVHPGKARDIEVKTPDGWAVESAWASDRAKDCSGEALGQKRMALKGSGTISLGPSTDAPCSVDLDVTLTMPLSGGDPEHETLRARGVRIENACK